MEELRVGTTVWRAALVYGSIRGCRPSPSIDYRLESIEKHDGVAIGPHDWPYYERPAVVDEVYAARLTLALADLPTVVAERQSVLGSSAPKLSDVQLRKLEEIRDWCAGGGFRVHEIAYTLTILFRPEPGEETILPTL